MTEEIKRLIEEQGRDFARLLEIKEESEKKPDGDALAKVDAIAKVIVDNEVHKQQLQEQKEEIKNLKASFHRTGGGVEKKSDFNKRFRQFLKASNTANFSVYDGEQDISKELRTDIDTQGGYAVMPDFTGKFTTQIFLTSPVRPYADVGTTSSDQVIFMDDLDDGSAQRLSQGQTITESTTATLGQRILYVKKYGDYVSETEEALEDPYFDLESWLIKKSVGKISRLQNYDFIWGNGVQAPEGILGSTTKAAGVGVSDTYTSKTLYYTLSGTADDFNLDTMMDLFFSVKDYYRNNAKYFMNSNSLRHVMKQKSGTSDFLMAPNLSASQQFTFFGKDIIIWEDLPEKDDATNKYPVLFGDMSEAYSIRDRRGIKMQKDPYTKPGFVKIYLATRTAGGVRNYEAVKAIKSNNT